MDIIALIFLCIRVSKLVKAKQQNTTPWVIRTIVLWIAAELAGFSISLYFGKDLYVCLASAWLCAAASYLYIEARIRKLPVPNKDRDWKDYLNQD